MHNKMNMDNHFSQGLKAKKLDFVTYDMAI